MTNESTPKHKPAICVPSTPNREVKKCGYADRVVSPYGASDLVLEVANELAGMECEESEEESDEWEEESEEEEDDEEAEEENDGYFHQMKEPNRDESIWRKCMRKTRWRNCVQP